jgi:hypothetical protein
MISSKLFYDENHFTSKQTEHKTEKRKKKKKEKRGEIKAYPEMHIHTQYKRTVNRTTKSI